MDATSPTDLTESAAGPLRLGPNELAVLQVFLDSHHRVVSRAEINRRAGLAGMSERRCDSILVSLRRVLGAESIRTVRGRGWMLEIAAVEHAHRLVAA
jgi:DNA-binding winged helix-turn-helix (wHTH) protein